MPDLDPTFGNQLQHITIIVSMLSGRETGYLRVRRTRRELLSTIGLAFYEAIIFPVDFPFPLNRCRFGRRLIKLHTTKAYRVPKAGGQVRRDGFCKDNPYRGALSVTFRREFR